MTMNEENLTTQWKPADQDHSGIVTWIHLGDLHMTTDTLQHRRDLRAIIDEINAAFVDGVSFVYLPGDIADDGSAASYAVVREELDRLKLPWCAIVGDHDVHEKSFRNFKAAMSQQTGGAFTVGGVRVFRLNAFDRPAPDAFEVQEPQLAWLQTELEQADTEGLASVLLLHCYPSDLKAGGDAIAELVRTHNVRLIDMGHTHYNELANDGHTLYAATRSTGQIEEGAVGYSITNIDQGVVSWKFFELGSLPAVMITSPADERLLTENGSVHGIVENVFAVRARIWSIVPIISATATIANNKVALNRVDDTNLWTGSFKAALPVGIHTLAVHAVDRAGHTAEDVVRIVVGADAWKPKPRHAVDHENALGAWTERGLLGTQLGPNKNGRKW